ncbi:class I SAM-dependent methyltransferase [Pseudonocardia endophytica]|uniref:Methyltransferase family protein n=1 Tax=Pseudonocardia endophytica TaxID=401976 RepID=A0A4R1HWG4_PSEEN|nr:class I SAM-dependent methyltransferase [Pseudonocardia endophytica]TCK26678.1 methyltransferase family protein [Pseudonocardia endophytica]
MTSDGWTWDPTLYAGSAAYYVTGRVPYPPGLASVLARALPTDGTGRLLDVGCGPGSLTLLLAPLFDSVVGVDADAEMLAVAAGQASDLGVRNVTWRHLRAESLPADLPTPTVVTFAQSFHWTDRPRVAAAVRSMLADGGALVHVHATTHEGDPTSVRMPHPQPPRAEIGALIRRYLGERRRAGRSVRPETYAPRQEETIYRAAGFHGPERHELPERTVTRSAEEVRASVYSLSNAAPHLFGDRFDEFDADLRALVDEETYSERLPVITIDVWR